MARVDPPSVRLGIPRLGRATRWMLAVVVGTWVAFAVGLNWAGADPAVFLALCGSAQGVWRGQVWRLVTPVLVHDPAHVWHLLTAVLGLVFFAPALEARWGGRRLVAFLVGTAAFGFATQVIAESVAPGWARARLGQSYFYGSIGAFDALVVAWALSARAGVVQLFFVLPVGPMALLWFTVALNVLRLFAADAVYEGIVTPFGSMAAGWLFGAGQPTPARRLWLRARYAWLARRARSRSGPALRLVRGAGGTDDDPDAPASGRRRPPPDRHMLN